MSLDLTKYKLISVTGDGRDGLQGRVFALGTSDDLATASTAGYLNELIDLKIPFDNRILFANDLILLNYLVGEEGEAWASMVVSYDSEADSYTITQNQLGTGGGGGGGVTSVGLALPTVFSVTGSPVTSTGTLTADLITQSANLLWAGPTTGAAAKPGFRTLVTADIPDETVTYSKLSTPVQLGIPYLVKKNSIAGGAASETVTSANCVPTDVIVAVVEASTNPVTIQKVVPGTGSYEIFFSADPGASTVSAVSYHTA